MLLWNRKDVALNTTWKKPEVGLHDPYGFPPARDVQGLYEPRHAYRCHLLPAHSSCTDPQRAQCWETQQTAPKFSTLFPSSTLWLLMLLTHFVPPPFQINSHHVARGDERFTEQATDSWFLTGVAASTTQAPR